jgi:hypothetical protein
MVLKAFIEDPAWKREYEKNASTLYLLKSESGS